MMIDGLNFLVNWSGTYWRPVVFENFDTFYVSGVVFALMLVGVYYKN
jgi:hypothetical protein